jgi:hypothetical protein
MIVHELSKLADHVYPDADNLYCGERARGADSGFPSWWRVGRGTRKMMCLTRHQPSCGAERLILRPILAASKRCACHRWSSRAAPPPRGPFATPTALAVIRTSCFWPAIRLERICLPANHRLDRPWSASGCHQGRISNERHVRSASSPSLLS